MMSQIINRNKSESLKGYHNNLIEKGILGEASKITEEYKEWLDARHQNAILMELLELSDLLGAIESYIRNYNLTLNDLIVMSNLTKIAFKNGVRR